MDFPIEFDRCPSGPHYRDAPRIDTPAPPDSPLAYCEDDIVAVMTDIYKHFVKVGYLPASEVVFPAEHLPDGRHTLNTSLYRDEYNMSPRVISLLERLPYIDIVTPPEPEKGRYWSSSKDIEWYPEALLIDYRDQEATREARDVAHISYWASGDRYQPLPDLTFMRPGDVALATPDNKNKQHMILDTEANSIRFMYHLLELPDDVLRDQIEFPHQEAHYRNFPGYHAPSVLGTFYEDLVSLRILPIATWADMKRLEFDNAAVITARVMRECFGWPNNFRQESWIKRVFDVEEEAEDAKDRLNSTAKHPDNWPPGVDWGPVFSEDRLKQATDEVLVSLGLSGIQLEGS